MLYKRVYGQVCSRFAYYQVSKGKTIKLSPHHCYLGDKVEVYDAELHACFETLSQINIHHPNLTKVHIILCIDNTATIETLSSDTHSHQYARQTIEEMNTLSAGGLKINTTWTPSHVNIQGNEDADTEAKRGATHTNVRCQHAVTTKTWMLAESKRQFLLAWK
jgi:ribonuclease HI